MRACPADRAMLIGSGRLPRPLRTFGDWVSVAERAVLVACLAAILWSVVWGVLTRYVSKVPASWTGEVASIAFCWLTMVGSSWLYAAHPRLFDPLALAPPWRRVAVLPSLALEIAVLLFVLVYAVRQAIVNFDNPTATLRVPTSVYYVPIVWFALASLLRALMKRG
jgi:TRAP-type C4-dicarboxylate transport system permease small subunit